MYTKKRLPRKKLLDAIELVLQDFKVKAKALELIYVNKLYIRNLNRKFFGVPGATDVISFPFEEEDFLGEIYVSVDTVEKQAKIYNTTFESELIRVTIHGLLHLLGFKDSTEKEKEEMHRLEDSYLLRIRVEE